MKPSLERASLQLADEHKRLLLLTGRLKSIDAGFDLTAFLEELHMVLINHFAHEQFPGGLYECMGAYGSEYHEELSVLIKQHCELLSNVRGLLERAKLAGPNDREPILTGLESVLSTLESHERREHTLANKLLGKSQACW